MTREDDYIEEFVKGHWEVKLGFHLWTEFGFVNFNHFLSEYDFDLHEARSNISLL